MNHSDEQRADVFAGRAAQLLHEQADGLDAPTRSRLNRARQQALPEVEALRQRVGQPGVQHQLGAAGLARHAFERLQQGGAMAPATGCTPTSTTSKASCRTRESSSRASPSGRSTVARAGSSVIPNPDRTSATSEVTLRTVSAAPSESWR